MAITYSAGGGVAITSTAQDYAQFADFARTRSDALHRTAYLMTGSREQAQDVVQTALIRLYRVWSRRGEWADLDAYARRTVTNVVLSSAKRHWWGERATDRLPERPSDGGIGDVAQREDLKGALMSLPIRQRTAVVLRYYLDLSEADSAATMDCPIGTLKSLASRGLTALRAQLSEVSA